MAEAKKSKGVGIKKLESRIEAIEEVLAAAAGGDFEAEIPIAMEEADVLTSVETGINLLISDLGDEVIQSQKRADELQEKLDLIDKQRQAIEELSTPIIKIWEADDNELTVFSEIFSVSSIPLSAVVWACANA